MATLEWEVLDTSGVEWEVQDGTVVSWLVQRGPVEIVGGGGGTTMPSGTAGQVPQVQSGSTYELVTPNTPNGLVRLDEDGTIPDILHPSTIARDTEVTAAIAAATIAGTSVSFVEGEETTSVQVALASTRSALESLGDQVQSVEQAATPLVADLVLGVAAVDGTATVFEILNYSRGTAASGVVPADWVSVFTVPDIDTLEDLMAMASLSQAKVFVPADDAVYRIVAGSIDQPWTDITPGVGTHIFGNAATGYWQGMMTPTGIDPEIQWAEDVPYTGSGLFTVNSTAQAAIDNAESTLDRIRVVSAFATTNVDLSGYVGVGSVAVQPTLDDGTQPAVDEDVWLFGQTDPDENGCYNVTSPDGVWLKYQHPSIFDPPGNGYRVFVNDPSSAAHGTIFMWLDADQTVKHRGSGTYPGSGDGGAWVRYAPPSQDLTEAPGGTSTVDVVSNVAANTILGRTTAGSGDSEELSASQVRTLIRDESDWHVIYDDVLESDGTFTAPTWTSDYTDIEVRVTGRGTDTSNASAGVRVRFNGDTGSNYFMNNGTAQTLWNNVGSMPGSQTNTDRQGLWTATIALGGVGKYTTADIRNVTWTSTATAGSAPTAPSAYYTNTSAAVTSIDVYLSFGTFAAGSRLTVRGRKAP